MSRDPSSPGPLGKLVTAFLSAHPVDIWTRAQREPPTLYTHTPALPSSSLDFLVIRIVPKGHSSAFLPEDHQGRGTPRKGHARLTRHLPSSHGSMFLPSPTYPPLWDSISLQAPLSGTHYRYSRPFLWFGNMPSSSLQGELSLTCFSPTHFVTVCFL